MATRDVQFVIKARDEASKAFESIAGAIQDLAAAQGSLKGGSSGLNTDLGALLATISKFDKASKAVGTGADQSEAAFNRQIATVKKLKEELASLASQRAAGERAKSSAQSGVVDAVLGGGDANAARAKVAAVVAEMGRLDKAQARISSAIQTESAGLEKLRSAYQQVAAVANSVEAAKGNVEQARTAVKSAQDSAEAAKEQASALAAAQKFATGVRLEAEKEAAAKQKAADALKDAAAAAAREANQSKFSAFMGIPAAPSPGAKPQANTAKASAAVFQEQIDAAEAVGKAFREMGLAEEEAAKAAADLRDRIAPGAVIQRQYAAEIAKVNALHKAGKIDAKEHAAAVKLLATEETEAQRRLKMSGKGENAKPGIFGLKPYEATNLGYQVNDVFTQLASGTGIMQVMAQQGGQILQLFPKLSSGIMAVFANPYFLGAAVVFGTIAMAVDGAANKAERLRTFSGVLKANADGARYSAQALNENVEALKQYRMSADDAVAISKTFLSEGLNPALFVTAGKAAKDYAYVTGQDVPTAAKTMAGAFTGGYNAIKELDDKLNFLSASERNQIKAMFESGKAAEARKLAFDKFNKSMGQAAEDMKGPWTKAIERVDSAWESFKGSMSDSGWAKDILQWVNDFATGLDALAKGIDVLNGKTGGGTSTDQKGVAADAVSGMALDGAPAASGDPKAGETQAELKARQDRLDQLAFEQRSALASSDASKIKIAGERAYRDEIERTGDAQLAAAAAAKARNTQESQIQQGRRQDLFGTASSFLGLREGDRQDNAKLQTLFATANIKLDPKVEAWCAAFVNAVLASKGLKGTGSNAAASFKDFGSATSDPSKGDIVVLKPQAKNSSGHVGFFAGFNGDGSVKVLGGNQGKQGAVTETSFKRNQVVGFRRPGAIGEGNEGLSEETKLAMDLAVAQTNFNHKLDEENVSRALTLKYLREQLGLSAKDLYDSQRRQAIEEAVTAAKKEATESHVAFSPEQQKALEASVGSQFDMAHAESLVNDQLREQKDLREALVSGITDAISSGDTETAARLTAELDAMKPALDSAITAAETFWKQFNTPESKAALEGLRRLRQEVDDTAAKIQKAKLDRLGRDMGGMQELRGTLSQQVDLSQLMGDKNGAQQAEAQLMAVNGALNETRDRAIAAAQALLAMGPDAVEAAGQTEAGLQSMILGLQQAKEETTAMSRQFLMTGKQINETLADMGANAIDGFFQKIANGESVIHSLWTTFVQFSADFLRQMAMMMLKQALFNALSAHSQSGGGGVGGLLSSAIGGVMTSAAPMMAAGSTLMAAGGVLTGAAAGIGTSAAALMASANALMIANSMGSMGAFHTGGIAGFPSMRISAHPSIFAGARRYHTGGLAGLKPDEVPAILKRGEEVLTEGDPRHRGNGGMGGGGGMGAMPQGIRQILAIGEDQIAAAMAGSHGDQVLTTWVRTNRASLRQMLGVG